MRNYIFDFDLTLVDSNRVNILATQKTYQRMNWPVPQANDILQYTGLPITKTFPMMAPKHVN